MQKKFKIGVCLFRRDLRVKQNTALHAAATNCEQVVALYQPCMDFRKPLGQNQQWWLSEALEDLKHNLAAKNIKLFFLAPQADLCKVVAKFGAAALFFNRIYLAEQLAQDRQLADDCNAAGIETFDSAGFLLLEPAEMANKAGKPFRVFTPFYKELCLRYQPPKLFNLPAAQQSTLDLAAVTGCSEKYIGQKNKAVATVVDAWTPTEAAAHKLLQRFCAGNIVDYSTSRDMLAANSNSHLSPYLHFGQLSPDQVWQYAFEHAGFAVAAPFVRQLVWREFAWHLLYHFPEIETLNFDRKFDNFSWEHRSKMLAAWQQGETGFPVVDAAMQELLATGYMHNRARMVVASFLVKDLLIDWRFGEAWFWQHLVDADEANNVIGWQWTAGCGPDPAPFFRIFNPILQGQKFDPAGKYIKQWLPQLERLEKKYLYAPWLADAAILRRAEIVLGKDYPLPVVDHKQAAKQALVLYKRL